MRFSFPTTTIASISGAAYLASSSTGVAASVSLAYEKTGSIRAVSTANKGAECSFVNGFKVQQRPDMGILACAPEETCVEDSSSSAGGRCVVLEDEFAIEAHRELAACTFANGTDGVKCQGVNACNGADTTKIGCGSCNGQKACNSWNKAFTVGEGSCVGASACYGFYSTADITIGSGSCVGKEACAYLYNLGTAITVGSGSCLDNVACKYMRGEFDSQVFFKLFSREFILPMFCLAS